MTMAIGRIEWPLATCTHKCPSTSSVATPVSEPHTSSTTSLEHLKPHKPPSTNMFSSFSIAPAMQTIIIDCVSIVDPQLATVI
jgi:hypothetical protein